MNSHATGEDNVILSKDVHVINPSLEKIVKKGELNVFKKCNLATLKEIVMKN